MIKRNQEVGREFDDDQIVWKYFQYKNFIKMLETKTLYMGRADLYEDKREFLATELHAHCFKMSVEDLQKSVDRIKENTYLSCWTMLEHESYLMWKAYSDLNTGIVVQSTPKRIMDSYSGDDHIVIGKVSYIDESTHSAQPFGAPLNWYYLVFSKLWFYEDERELRLSFEDFTKTGSNVKPINLETLITGIRVAPKANDAFFEKIQGLVRSAGLKCRVLKSEIEINS